MKEIHTPNLIVGGGPVGLVLGIELATRGVPCLLVNEGKTTPAHPQGNTQNARSMEHYRRLGIAERIRNSGLPRDHTLDITYVTRVIGYELARIRMPSTEENLRENAPDRILTPEPLHRVSQMMVEAILKAHIDTLPAADVRFGWR